nr:uncharacterized protein LOC109428054 [Aedes albopictus]
MDCNKKFQLIKLWEQHPVLWDRDNPDRLRKDAQKQARETIAAKLGVDVETVKKAMNGLKAQLSGECTKVRKGGKNGNDVYNSKWIYYSALQFLTRGKTEAEEIDPLNDIWQVKNEHNQDDQDQDQLWENHSSASSYVPSISFDDTAPALEVHNSTGQPSRDRTHLKRKNSSSDGAKLLSKCIDILSGQSEPKKMKSRATILGESTSSLLETLWAEDFSLYKEYAVALRNLNNKFEQAYEDKINAS